MKTVPSRAKPLIGLHTAEAGCARCIWGISTGMNNVCDVSVKQESSVRHVTATNKSGKQAHMSGEHAYKIDTKRSGNTRLSPESSQRSWDYLIGGTARWKVLATCATCPTRWPMARQSLRKDVCNIAWTIDPVQKQSQLQAHLFEKRHKTARIWKMLHGIFMGYYVSSDIHEKTVQAPRSRTRRKAVVSMCRWISQTLGSSSTPKRRNASQGNPLSKMKKENKKTTLSKKKAVQTWSTSGDFKNRHREVHRTTLHIRAETTFSIPMIYVDVVQTTTGIASEHTPNDC